MCEAFVLGSRFGLIIGEFWRFAQNKLILNFKRSQIKVELINELITVYKKVYQISS